MTSLEIKELLEKQMNLLSKESEKATAEQLPELTAGIVRIADLIFQNLL